MEGRKRRLALSAAVVGLLVIAGVPATPWTPEVDLAPTAQAGSTHLSGKKIALDPGHGGSDPGAVGNGLREKDLNLDVALRARDLLEAEGASVYMTRTTDTTVSLSARSSGANSWGAHRFISIHTNACGCSTATGTETYYYSGLSSGSTAAGLARLVQEEAVQHGGLRDRGVKSANFHVLRETNMPAVLLEMGFIDNPSDAAKLGSASWRQEIARAVLHAVQRHYGITPHDPSSPPPPSDFTVSIVRPGHNVWVKDTVIAKGSTNQECCIQWMRFLVDGVVTKWVTPSPHEWAWNTHGWADGAHKLKLESRHDDGRLASDTHTVKVDNTPPTTSSSSSGTLGTNGWYRSAVAVSFSASDGSGSGVARTEHRVDGGGWSAGTSVVVAGDGIHTVQYRSIDAVGNVEATRSRAVKVDTTPPSVAIASPQANRGYVMDQEIPGPDLPWTVVMGDKTVLAPASDAVSGLARVELRVDDVLRSSGPSTWVWPAGDEALGDHALQATAVDQAGNRRAVSMVVRTVPTSPEGLSETLGL